MTKIDINRTHEIYLFGGIGNQLFQLAKAMQLYSTYAAREVIVNFSLNYDRADISNYLSLRGFGIVRKKSKFAKVQHSVLERKLNPGVHYESSSFFEGWSSRDKWYGYFQSSGLALGAVLELEDRIRENSSNLSKMIDSERNIDSIGVHIRQGDYVNNRKYVDLGYGYYQNALCKILRTKSYEQIVIYSDSPLQSNPIATKLREEFQGVTFYDSSGESDFSTLLEMSAHSGLVLANSTFSWWAAALRTNDDKIVVRPKHYFKERNLALDFYPKCWIISE
jgi:hypothetical protein